VYARWLVWQGCHGANDDNVICAMVSTQSHWDRDLCIDSLSLSLTLAIDSTSLLCIILDRRGKLRTYMSLVANWHIIQRRTLGVMVDPVEDLGVPDQAVLLLQHPVVLVGEVQEARWNTAGLENIEEAKTIGLG
jgi:hypothetical protein